jgi:tetratricopeptide (TPR) repeat protein
MSVHKSPPLFGLWGLPALMILILTLVSIDPVADGQEQKRVQGSHPDVQTLLQKGTEFYYKSQFDQAVEILSRVIAREPNTESSYQAFIHRGSALGYLGQKEKALKDFERALQTNSRDPFLYYMRAVTVFATKTEFDRAIEDLNYALSLTPNPSLALSIYLSRSDFHAQQKEFDLALDGLNQALHIGRNNETIPNARNNFLLLKGVDAYDRNQYEQAVETLNQVIANKPHPKILYPALIHRGSARGYLGQKEKALIDFEEALRINARDPSLYYLRAVTVFATKTEFDRAIEDLNYALSLHPNPSLTLSIYLSRSHCYAQKGEFNLARADLNQAIRLDPYSTTINMNSLANLYSAKGDILKRKGQYDQALQHYSEAILLNQQNPRAFSGRAFAKILKGDKKEAIPDLQTACQLGQQNACQVLDVLQK